LDSGLGDTEMPQCPAGDQPGEAALDGRTDDLG
jgi:hypothetical protein